MPIQFFNTMGRRKEEFKPTTKGKVGMYCCGPTVYNYAHIGNLRTYVFEDILRRVLEFNNLRVKHVMNITDVGHLTSDADIGEDKMEVGAEREKKTVWEIAEFYTKSFFDDTEKLNILRPSIICKATDHIKDMIKLIQELELKGYTYIIDDGVYFDTSKFRDYGNLLGMTFETLKESMKAGARVEFNAQKRNISDFALWKFSPQDKKRQMEWESPWGIGFPGWHIECSAMSMKYLGRNLDIHCGGIDHISVHHMNEIAQSEGAMGRRFFNFWLHGNFLILTGKAKMAKSKENFITLQTLIDKGFDPLTYRYLCLTANYRSELEFSWENLKAAQNALDTLRENIRSLRDDQKEDMTDRTKDYLKRFLEAINDDLNMPEALLMVWETVRNRNLNNVEKLNLLLEFDKVLGLDLGKEEELEELPDDILRMIDERERLRKKGDYGAADEIREKLYREFNIALEDTSKGFRWKRVKTKENGYS